MSFDPTTAKPVEEFDPSSAKPDQSGIMSALGVLHRAAQFTPGGMLATGLEKGGEVIDKAAYGLGGTVTDQAAKVLPAEAAAGLGYATNVATQAVPALMSGGPAKAAAPLLKSSAEHLMQSALKPSAKSLVNGEAARAISTLLDEGINVTKGGVQKLRDKIGELNAQITEAIVNSPATVHKGRVASELQGTLKKFEKQVNPSADVKAIESAWTEFLNHPLLHKLDEIPVQIAQELKQGTYRVLKGKYGEQGSAATEAQKTLARGLKEGIAEAVPGVAKLNAQESAMLGALNLAERRALMELNKNPAGLSLLAKNPEAAMGFLADRSGLFKSLAARMIYQGQEQIPATVARVIGGTGMAVNNAPGLQ